MVAFSSDTRVRTFVFASSRIAVRGRFASVQMEGSRSMVSKTHSIGSKFKTGEGAENA
jgi:hypothetical protein